MYRVGSVAARTIGCLKSHSAIPASVSLGVTTAHTDALPATAINGDNLADAIRLAFARNPQDAAFTISNSLGLLDKSVLINTISSQTRGGDVCDPHYVENLFRSADVNRPDGSLDREEFAKAMLAHKTFSMASHDIVRPTPQQLMRLALAAGLPYIGFGFLDNFIMITAGEEIDSTICAYMGFSTMAAAGLGNLISDLAGVAFADTIEGHLKRFAWCRQPTLSRVQKSMRISRVTRMGGTMLGVSIGCVLGMAPLLWWPVH